MAAGHVRRIGGAPVRSARHEPVPTALLLAGASIGIVAIRRGSVPSAKEAAYLGIGSLGLVLLAGVAPDLVVATLSVAFLLSLLTSEPIVLQLAAQADTAISSLWGSAAGGARTALR